MQTSFSAEQLRNPDIVQSNEILRKCVHCGFCTATCPTYVLLGDELDSPRGRIYLIKKMLEEGKPATASMVKHIDRCLTCLSCKTTCPSGVDYGRLVDHARVHIEKTYKRPLFDRALRETLSFVIPNPLFFRLALIGAWLGRPLAPIMPGRLKAMLKMAPKNGPYPPSPLERPQTIAPQETRHKRVMLMTGCAQQVLEPSINEATVRVLTRLGAEVVIAEGQGCCGALNHHMGAEEKAQKQAAANVKSWLKVHHEEPVDAIVFNASGCGTTLREYGHLLRHDKELAEAGKEFARLSKDVSEVLADLMPTEPMVSKNLNVTYHSACSMQHGLRIKELPKQLLEQAGFKVSSPQEGHLCCGSAGIYNIMQPEIADKLKDRKIGNIKETAPDIVATGNIGCLTQIKSGVEVPVVHSVELLDWATGGPRPDALGKA